MINEIKKCLRLIPYGYGVKMNLILGLIVFLLGLAELLADSPAITFSASVFVTLGCLACLQITSSLLYSGIVAASPKRRALDIGIGDATAVGASVIGYLTVNGYIFLHRESFERAGENMILASLCMAISVLYFAVAYKIYLVGSILYAIAIFGCYGLVAVFFEVSEVECSMTVALVISVLIMVLGVVLSSLCRRLLYKRRLSPMACGAALRKAMQS